MLDRCLSTSDEQRSYAFGVSEMNNATIVSKLDTAVEGAQAIFGWHHDLVLGKYRGNVGIGLMADSFETVGARCFVTSGEWLVVQDAPPAFLDGRQYAGIRPTATVVRCLPFGPYVGGINATTDAVGWRNVNIDRELAPRQFVAATAVDVAMSTAAIARKTWDDLRPVFVSDLKEAGIEFAPGQILINPYEGKVIPYQGKDRGEPVPMCRVPADLLEAFLDAAIREGNSVSRTLLSEVCVAASLGLLPKQRPPLPHWGVVNNRATVTWQEIFNHIGGEPADVIFDWLYSQGVQLEGGDMLFPTRLAGRGLLELSSSNGHCYEVTSLMQDNYLEEAETFILTPPVITEGWDTPFLRYPGGLVIDLAFERNILAS
jgi:hypothetical protein